VRREAPGAPREGLIEREHDFVPNRHFRSLHHAASKSASP
jgi:hypothetical protein